MSSSPEVPALDREALRRWDDELIAATTSPMPPRIPVPPVPDACTPSTSRCPGSSTTSSPSGAMLARQATESYPEQWHDVLVDLAGADTRELEALTLAKLRTEPIEDLRIDFEDGFRAHRGTEV